MVAYRLDNFDGEDRNRGGLETIKADILERERNDAYARGFKDGVAVTRDAVETETNKLLSAIAEAAADLKISHEEACLGVMRSTAPVIDAVIDLLAPRLAATSFPEILREHVLSACRRVSEGEVIVEVAPGQAALLENIGSDMEVRLGISETPGLDENTARIHWAGGTDRIDMSLTLAAIENELEQFVGALTNGPIGTDNKRSNNVG